MFFPIEASSWEIIPVSKVTVCSYETGGTLEQFLPDIAQNIRAILLINHSFNPPICHTIALSRLSFIISIALAREMGL